MHDVERSKLKLAAKNDPSADEARDRTRYMHETMTCHERLAQAIQLDKIKIYPDGSSVIEKTQRRAVKETHHERVGLKHENNPLHEAFGGDEQYLHFDDADAHEALIESGMPQTWYFAIADCDGRLEVFRDEEGGRDHLLGLDMLWVDIDDSDFDGFESDRKGLTPQ